MSDKEFDIVDEEDALAQRARGGVPIEWKAAGSDEVVGRDMLIQQPTQGQVNLFSQARVRTCSGCRSFAHEHFQQKDVKRGFIRMLWEEWGAGGHRYVGDRPDRLGRCKQDASLAVGPSSLACSHYKALR